MRMSIGHSSSAYSLLVVKPSGSVSAASTMMSCQPQKWMRAQPVAEHARLAEPLQRVVDADEDGVAGEGEDRGVGVQRPQPAVRQRAAMPAEQVRKHQLERHDQPDQERDEPPAAVATAKLPRRWRCRTGTCRRPACRADGHGVRSILNSTCRSSLDERTVTSAASDSSSSMRTAGVQVSSNWPDCARPRRTPARNPAGHGAARGDEQHDDAHDGSIRRADQRIAPALTPTIVSELSGHEDRRGQRRERAGERQRESERRCRRSRSRSRAQMTCARAPRVARETRAAAASRRAGDHRVARGHEAGGVVRHGDADVGGGERAGVVEPVADHQHATAGSLRAVATSGELVLRRLAEPHARRRTTAASAPARHA